MIATEKSNISRTNIHRLLQKENYHEVYSNVHIEIMIIGDLSNRFQDQNNYTICR